MFHSFGTPIGCKIQDGLEQYLQCSLAGQGENSITVHNSNCSSHFQMIRMSNYLKIFMGHFHSPNLWFCHCIMAKSKKLKGMESSEVCMSLTLLLHLLVVNFPCSLLAQVLSRIQNTCQTQLNELESRTSRKWQPSSQKWLKMAMKVKTCCSSEGFSELKHGIFPFLKDKGEGGSARPYPNKTTL